MTRYALTVLLCLSPMVAMADGNELLSGCQKIINAQDTQKWLSPDDSYVGGNCLGVVRTVASLGRELPADLQSCTPPGIPTTQAVRVIVKWLKENPSVLNHDAAFLAAEALKESFPCK